MVATKSIFDIAEIKKIRIDPEDVILIKVKGLNLEIEGHIHQAFYYAFGDIKVVVIEDGVDISIVSKERGIG